jgi:CRISPR-associated protein Cas5d
MAKIIVSGPRAIFTRPELKVERISYPVITPSAARGVFEAILWKPAIRWRIHRIAVLNPIEWTSFRRNEVNNRAVAPAVAVINDGGLAPVQFAESDRSQRNTVALRDVAYEIEASFEMTDRAGKDDSEAKFADMFRRRVSKGQHFHQPYLGCRECIADVLPSDGKQVAISESKDLGLMLYDIDFSQKDRRPFFYHAEMKNGIITVPSFEDVKKLAKAKARKNK